MVDALGDTGHSRFLSPDAFKKEQDVSSGKNSFEGIGATVESRNGVIMIVSPIDGSPAQKAGLLPGDMILKADGKDLSGLSASEASSLIRGPAGTTVVLTIFSPSTNLEREVTLTRAKITVVNVTWQTLPGTTIAHLRISQYSSNTAADVKKALQEIKQQNMTAIVLDLRNNPGGQVPEVIGVTSQFLSSGTVFIEKDAAGKEKKMMVEKGGLATSIPMVVLVNKGSASGSEITAGAIQDAGRGKLVGETTFGTGTVLTYFPLSDGSVILLAIQEWLTPKGRVIWHTGIVPDFEIKLDLNVRGLSPEQERSMSAADLQASKDTQLLKAIELLKAP
jgi:carboxyl-terminal processing protease